MSERAGSQWRIRGVLEEAGLRVLSLQVFPERPFRWSVRVVAEESSEREIRDLKGVDVVRYWRLPGVPGEPDEFVVTVDEPRPTPTLRGPRPPSPRRGSRGPGRWLQT